MSLAFICSNAIPIGHHTKKGTEIFIYDLIAQLKKQSADISMTAFSSSDSQLPIPIESLDLPASSNDQSIPLEKHIVFELALIAKAASMQNKFDLFHVNIGDGDIVLPFARFIQKPIIITIHHVYDKSYAKKYFSLFKNLQHVYFVSPSNAQRNLLPNLQYAQTIYHGIDENKFTFDEKGGDNMLWIGRGVPEKGLDMAFEITRKTQRKTTFCIIQKKEQEAWLKNTLQATSKIRDLIQIAFDVEREMLVEKYRKSKLFLSSTRLEEVFGLVLIEAMGCGTPVVAFAKGAVPEIIKDGENGFLVNPSENDKRGDFVVKKTGIEGLIDAIKRLYSLPQQDYHAMRRACRKRVEEKFTLARMAKEYSNVYKYFHSHLHPTPRG